MDREDFTLKEMVGLLRATKDGAHVGSDAAQEIADELERLQRERDAFAAAWDELKKTVYRYTGKHSGDVFTFIEEAFDDLDPRKQCGEDSNQ